jgi:hypothetical protein
VCDCGKIEERKIYLEPKLGIRKSNVMAPGYSDLLRGLQLTLCLTCLLKIYRAIKKKVTFSHVYNEVTSEPTTTR